jgi:uncharacterized protein YcfL
MKNISKISLLLVLAISLLAIGCKKAAEPVVADETAMENTVDTTAVAVDTTTVTSAEVATTTATV